MVNRLIVGCGYLGIRVAEKWLQDGGRVFATTRSENKANEFRLRGIEPIVCNVLQPETLIGLPAVNTILYAVGHDRSSGRTMHEIYVGGLRNLINSVPTANKMVYISSTSVYGQTDGEPVDEESATEPMEASGKIVLEAENVLRSSDLGKRTVILRFAGIYGPDRFPRLRVFRSGYSPQGDSGKWLNLIHVEDGANAVIAAEASGSKAVIYNVSDGAPVRLRHYDSSLAKLSGIFPPELVTPTSRPVEAKQRLANRRILNRRMREELHITLKYPSFQEGLPAAWKSSRDLGAPLETQSLQPKMADGSR